MHEPDDGEKETLDEAWRKLLSQCTARKLESRLHDFGVVLERLREVEAALTGRPRPAWAPVPKLRPKLVETPPPPWRRWRSRGPTSRGEETDAEGHPAALH